MALRELLQILGETAKLNKLRTPYIVGGIPRDILLDSLEDLHDVDITTGSEDINKLAELFAQKLGTTSKEMKDGHHKVIKDGIAFDFSSNFQYENIDDLLAKRGMFRPSNLMRETYSRDFTVNTLLVPLNFSQIFDLTGMGKNDIESKILRCPADCDASFKASPIRIIRAFYYSAKYGFKISDDIKEAIKNNLDLIPGIEKRYVMEKINYVIDKNPDMLNEMIELGVISKVPMTKDLSRALIKAKKLLGVI